MMDLPKVTLTTVEVVEPDARWPELFAEAAAWLQGVFGENFVRIHHIGSTAIPGIRAKPIIDMLLEVADIEQVDGLNEVLAAAGYVAYGEFGLAGRRYFPRTINGRRSHNLHIYQHDNPAIVRHLAFRDYMIAHPDEAQVYSELKASLAAQFQHDFEAYMDGKNVYIKEMEQRALRWWEGGE
ncbi:MAG: GrpB family protein [Anaerolineales bacterium]|nr:GrpB family protein [Anaerolineales bacterium]